MPRLSSSGVHAGDALLTGEKPRSSQQTQYLFLPLWLCGYQPSVCEANCPFLWGAAGGAADGRVNVPFGPE